MFFGLIFFQSEAQNIPQKADSTEIVNFNIPKKKHEPGKATIFSAVLPGLGQIYNKRYWKVPIVYGGFVGLGYFISNYNQQYLSYKQAYYDLNDNNPKTNSYQLKFPDEDFKNITSAEIKSFNNSNIIPNIDFFRKKRDLYIIATVGFYLLNILDANVDAHLIDFDISEDLSLNIQPYIADPMNNSIILGANVALTF